MRKLLVLTASATLILGFSQPSFAQDSGTGGGQAEPGTEQDTGEIVGPLVGRRVPPEVEREIRGFLKDREQPLDSDGAMATEVPSVLAILAHPDDEITIAPVLARIARNGGNVTIVFATSGDAGPGVSGMEPGAELAAMRENEARCSAFALGLSEPVFWQMRDGNLAPLARRPDSPMRDMLTRIAALIEEHSPNTIMTWGPEGGYGHADHRAISNAVTEVVQGMGEGRPDLLYAALPADSVPPIPEFERWGTTHPSLVTDRIRYEPMDLQATETAVGCYESQFGEEARALLPSLLHETLWRGTVFFRLAFPSSR